MPVQIPPSLPARYRGAQLVGRGAMGEIYRATDTTLGRAVAIKILAERYANNTDIRERFTREALSAARVSGAASIVTIYDVGEFDERPYIVMEYFSGGSLDERLRRAGAQPPALVLEWLQDAARALDAAHAEGVVHRDVKPANLLLDREGNVHVADFGIASAAGLDSLTQTGTILGTAGYLSPEQARGERATPASDRYALAVVAFELLTGSRPFEAESTTAEAAAHVHQPVPSVCDRLAELPCELDPVFARALAKQPDDRYPSCREFVAELRHALWQAEQQTRVLTQTAQPAPVVHRAPPRQAGHRRAPWLWPLVALLGLGAVGGAVAAAITSSGKGSPAASSSPRTQTIVRTVTSEGSTAQVTTTVSGPASSTSTTGGPHSLTDQSTSLLRSGQYEDAASLAEQAARDLAGAGPADPYEAYANFDAGYALYRLGRCAEAVTFLEKAQSLEPQRAEPPRYLARARACA